MKNYLKHGIISIVLVVLSLAGCKADQKEFPSVPQACVDSSIPAISSEIGRASCRERVSLQV